MANLTAEYDVIVVGGGLIGMAAALSLAKREFKVFLIEATEPQEDIEATHPSFDDRTLVINPASQRFWQNLGIWSDLLPQTTAIKQVHVSQAGRFGAVHFTNKELQVPQLAHVIEAKVLGLTLWHQVKQQANITLVAPAELSHYEEEKSAISVHYTSQDNNLTVKAKLLLAADGAQSRLRQLAALSAEIKDYRRTAIIANINTDKNHQQCAYERLSASGPLALLPFHQRCGLVWTLPTDVAKKIMACDDALFREKLQAELGYRLGAITRIGKRSSYPLYRVKVAQQYRSRLLLLGNAAHTVSPVSAQGLNLGVRGIDRLLKVLLSARDNNNDIGSLEVLKNYQHKSQSDQHKVLTYTDDLMTWFKIDEPFINAFRSLGLLTVNAQPGLKRHFYRLAGGLS